MSSWGERMASVVTACGPRPIHHGLPYHRRVEKVKFGVPLDQVCKRDIPGPLLVMLLKLNKEGPFKKDVFRAPGHQGNMNKLIHFLQQGRLVNIHSFSVNTIASVLKQFLRKIPGGIFGRENEAILFTLVDLPTEEEKLALAQRVFLSLPLYSQHLLVLLFGTFRVIHSNSEAAKTGMTAEALGVSVAPSFFQTCVTEGKIAKPEEVQKFKVATRITTFFIEHFGMRDLFGRENYEYYARLTGRILKVEDEWIFFTYPPFAYMGSAAGSASGAGGSAEAINKTARDDSGDEADVDVAGAGAGLSPDHDVGAPSLDKSKTGSLEIIPENCPLDPNGRLSISLDDQNVSSPSPCESPGCIRTHHLRHRDFRSAATADASNVSPTSDFRSHTLNRPTSVSTTSPPMFESATSATLGRKVSRAPDQKTYTCLPQVHQKQTERMKYRSEWFLSDPTGLVTVKCRQDRPLSLGVQGAPGVHAAAMAATTAAIGSSSPHRPSSVLHPPSATSPRPSTLRTHHSTAFPSPSSPFGRPLTAAAVCDSKFTSASMSSSLTPSRLATSANLKPTQQNIHQIPTMSKGNPQDSLQQQQLPVRLRRRLSDKDKERRLVRRSSSKRKDKENGGGGSSTSLDRQAASTSALTSSTVDSLSYGGGPREAVARADRGSRSGSLKRAGSAEASSSSSPRGSSHALLCRTGSQDTPHDPSKPPAASSSRIGSSETLGSESSLTRSLPRI